MSKLGIKQMVHEDDERILKILELEAKNIDSDLDSMSRDELVNEVKKLRAGIRHHRDAEGHELCWYVPELWSLVPERTLPDPYIPPNDEFMQCCQAYRNSLNK